MNVRDLISGKVFSRLSARLLFVTVTLLALPLTAWADDDDMSVPLSPKVVEMQNRTIGIILLLIFLAIVWYNVRRWQITRSGNQVHGTNRNQD